MNNKFARKRSAVSAAIAAVGLSILATLNYAQQTSQSQVNSAVDAGIRAGNSVQTIIAAQMKAGRDPALIMASLSVAMSQGQLKATPGEVFTAFAKAAPNQVTQLAAAAVQQFGRNNVDINSGDRVAQLAQNSPTSLMNAIVAATPTGQLGSVMSAVFGAASSVPRQSANAVDLAGLVYAATQAIANDSRSGTSPEFTPGAAVATAVGTLNNRSPDDAIRVAQAAVLALPSDTQSVIRSLSKLENTENGMSSAAMVALKAAVTQTIVSNPSQASTIAGYATSTIVANIQSRNSSDQAPLANIVMQGVVDGIIRSPSLSNSMEGGAVIAQAISSAASYASAPSLVTSMLSNTTAYLNGAATPANSANFSGMLQNAQERLVSSFPNQSTAITAISTTVQPVQIAAQTPGTTSNAVTSPTDSTSVAPGTDASSNSSSPNTNSGQSSPTDPAANAYDRINRASDITVVIAALIKEGVLPENIALLVAQTATKYPTDVIATALAAAGVPPDRVVSALVAAAPPDQKMIVQGMATLAITPTAAGPAPAPAPAPAAAPAPAPATATFTSPSSGGGGGTSTASTN